jgi:hypothetical protein
MRGEKMGKMDDNKGNKRNEKRKTQNKNTEAEQRAL